MKKKRVDAVDLFCGAGGTTTGLLLAGQELGKDISLVAINHWEIAIETNSLNHPGVTHLCDDLEQIDPRELVPSGKLRVMVASPECTHFSNARGGEPMSKQSRATIRHVIRWCSVLDIQDVLIENVREFMDWGPLYRNHPDPKMNGHPIKARKGEYFRHFVHKLERLGYKVEWRVLCAADYGDPTSRKRLFIRVSKNGKITWPEPTHARQGGETLFGKVNSWRTAREVIDWSNPGESIFNRKRPLSPNTLKRIEAGLRKFCGLSFVLPLEGFYRGNQPRSIDEPLPTIVASRGGGSIVNPFLVKLYRTGEAASVDDPLPTVTAQGNHLGLVQPFILGIRGGNDGYMRGASVAQPVPAITGHPALSLVTPFIVPTNHGQDHRTYSVDRPFPTVTSVDAWSVISPFVIQMDFSKHLHMQSVDEPMRTITSADARALVSPFLIKYYQGSDAQSVDDPMPTITANYEHIGVVRPFLVQYHGASYPGGDRVRSVDEPLATVAAGGNQHGLVQPFLIKYYGAGIGQPVTEPLGTVTSKDHFALCVPMTDGLYLLDILFRMLRPDELAAAMSFPKTYCFSGNREEKVRQIGNAVPVNLAKALCKEMLQ
jgi:DNA (cytosine-5)-methyltransferase 1